MNTKPRPASPGGAFAVAHTLTANDAATLTLKVAEQQGGLRGEVPDLYGRAFAAQPPSEPSRHLSMHWALQ
jgi:hypothetical protein